jgi:enolase
VVSRIVCGGPIPAVRAIAYRRVLNSHVEFTTEFVVTLDDGALGVGASPKGETISIYEDWKVSITPETIIRALEADGYVGRAVGQEEFDDYLQEHITVFGRNNAYSLSLALLNATSASRSLFELFGKPMAKLVPPRLCCNILNGGWHAYTNPVQSDFSEHLLVARNNHIDEVIGCHNEIQQLVKERLLKQPNTVVGGNPVYCFATADNRECIEFLVGICASLGLSDRFDLMIDASAGDLWTGDGYRLAITDGLTRSSEQFHDYWITIIDEYNLRYLEDPFRETDAESWQRLATSQQACCVIGDNFYSSDAGRIEEGAAKKHTHGAVIKPNQAGTVTAVKRAIEAAQRTDQIVITSHRSISTEETFVSTLTCMYGVPYIKIGPLMTDYSSVLRLNEIIRLTGQRT